MTPRPTRGITGRTPLNILKSLVQHPDYSILTDPYYFQEGYVPVHSPLLLEHMERAVSLLRNCIKRKGHVVVLGDRDADGVTSTALLGSFLREHHETQGGELTLLVSDEGDDYGLVGDLFRSIRDRKPDLVILLDMGSAHGDQINTLLKGGSKVIVLDHHQIQNPPPADAACAFLNPLTIKTPLEHEGRVATAALVFKFLLAYVMSHTKEWERGYLVLFPEMSPDPGLTGPGYLYRCGHYLGRYETLADAEQRFKQILPGGEVQSVDLTSHPLFQMDHTERENLKKNPVQGGKMLLARQIQARSRLRAFVEEIADLAALGLMTDMMPLVGENRTLARLGTGRLRSNPEEPAPHGEGYGALLKHLKINPDRITGKDLGWSVGPVINAAGRMGRTRLALDLLVSRNSEEAKRNARELLQLNEERKERTRKNEEIIHRMLGEEPPGDAPLIFCYHPDLLPGVSGILASRLLEQYARPIVYINQEGERARGSLRTPAGVDGVRILEYVKHLLIQYGGHAQASGFSLETHRIPELKNTLAEVPGLESIPGIHGGDEDNPNVAPMSQEYKRETLEESNDSVPHHLELTLDQLNWSLMEELDRMEPFGAGNPEPLLKISGVQMENLQYLTDGRHARFRVRGTSGTLPFVAWSKGARIKDLISRNPRSWELSGHLEVNAFMGKETLQFRVEHILAR